MKNFLHAIGDYLRLFVIVFGFTMLATIIFMVVFDANCITRTFLLDAVIFCFVALIPVLVFLFIPEEVRDMHVILLHGSSLIFNELTLMPLGYKIGMWNNVKSGILMAVIILAVNLLTPLAAWGRDALLTKQINDALNNLREEE